VEAVGGVTGECDRVYAGRSEPRPYKGTQGAIGFARDEVARDAISADELDDGRIAGGRVEAGRSEPRPYKGMVYCCYVYR
jgi:hypothetical protein